MRVCILTRLCFLGCQSVTSARATRLVGIPNDMACAHVLIHHYACIFTLSTRLQTTTNTTRILQYQRFKPLYIVIQSPHFMHVPMHPQLSPILRTHTRTRKYHRFTSMSTLIYHYVSLIHQHSLFMHSLCMLNKGYTRIFRIL